MVLVLILIARLTLPVLILRRPLIGGVLVVAADALDYSLFSRFGWSVLGGPGVHYQTLDKLLDMYYLALEVYMVRLWQAPLYRVTGYALFAWRTVGVLIFLYFQNEIVLFIFPNIFETFFLTMLFTGLYERKRAEPDVYLMVMAFCSIQKLLHEYALHVKPINWSVLFG